MRARTAIAATLVAALAGCASCDSVPAGAVTDCNAQVVPAAAATDILFVVDDSGSMAEEQEALASNLGLFIEQLLGSAITLDLRVGVTNASVEDYTLIAGTTTGYGRPGNPAGFPGVPGTPYPQGTLVAIEQDPQGVGTAGHFLWGTAYDDPAHLTSTWGGPRVLSSGGGAAAIRDFKANVKQGVWGASREQPLSAMRRALQKASCPGINCGFLRDGARLAVVILTDEDDCSGPFATTVTATSGINSDLRCHNPSFYDELDPLADFASYLDTTVGGEPIVALIAGFDASGNTSICRGATFGNRTSASALPTRLNSFVDLLDPAHVRTVKASICMDFGQTLLDIAAMIIPQTMPLKEAPADYRMMAVSVQKASGAVVGCAMAPAGSSGVTAPEVGVVYAPAPPGGLPSLTFQNACLLEAGDKVNVNIVCAR